MMILHSMALINDQVLPFYFRKDSFVFHNVFISGQQYIKATALYDTMQLTPLVRGALRWERERESTTVFYCKMDHNNKIVSLLPTYRDRFHIANI